MYGGRDCNKTLTTRAFQTIAVTCLGPDPFHTSISIQLREVIPDQTLQEVINKIFPWMKAQEEGEECDFYARRGITLKPEYKLTGADAKSRPQHVIRGGARR